MNEKAQRKKPGRKPGVKVTHGAYSLIARGEFPSKRRYIERWLSEVRQGMIRDLGPAETDLSTAQAILIDRVIGKLGILRCIEEHVREKGVMKGNDISSCLAHNYLSWANSLRLDLLALGIGKKNAERLLSPLEIAAEVDAENAIAEARGSAVAASHEPDSSGWPAKIAEKAVYQAGPDAGIDESGEAIAHPASNGEGSGAETLDPYPGITVNARPQPQTTPGEGDSMDPGIGAREGD
jgi:hypothetical protein